MQVTVNLNTCRQCHHVSHSGGFTIRGARQICGHSDACKVRKTREDFASEYPEYVDRDFEGINKGFLPDWKYHWYNRIVDAEKNIPSWCPLKHGSSY